MDRISKALYGMLFFCITLPGLVTALEATGPGAVPDGKVIYEQNCRSCHAMKPPATSAPPIVALASRYRTAYSTRDEAVEAMTGFMKAPTEKQALLGRGAIKRFGLMPAMTISDAELNAVSGWLWDQYDPGFDTGKCR